MTTITKLSELVPARTAGQLPSSRTFGLTEQALASDDIDTVKAQLTHVWEHYQSLEFFLSDRESNLTAIKSAIDDPDIENDIDPLELVVGFYATAGIAMAYEAAHFSSLFLSMGMNGQEALQTIYTNLDFSDPSDTDVVDLDAPAE